MNNFKKLWRHDRCKRVRMHPTRPHLALVITDDDGNHLFAGESLLGVRLGGLRVGAKATRAREARAAPPPPAEAPPPAR